MCIIITGLRKDIKKDEIEKAMKRHPDGFGVMWYDNMENIVKTYRTLSKKMFLQYWYDIPPDSRVSFHSRWATNGSIKTPNCHPWKSEKLNCAFMHNGVLSIKADGDTTDSETWFRKFEKENNVFQDVVDKKDDIGKEIKGSKFVFMNSDGSVTIVNESDGIWNADKTVWYSNNTIGTNTYTHTTYYTGNQHYNYGKYNRTTKSTGKNEFDDWY